MRFRAGLWVLFAALSGAMSMTANAADNQIESAVVAGQVKRIWSVTLNEERRLLIRLPDHYAQSNRSYPVLYLLDADEQFLNAAASVQTLSSTWVQRMPETLIVGIVNTERDRDFRPPMVPTAPDSETFAADKFLEFIVDELIPWTQAHYRTAAYRVLAGHSDGGLFTSYALVNRPKAFQSYIALSPALQEAKGSTLAELQLALTRVDAPLQLFLSWSGTDIAIRASTQNLVTALTKRPPRNVRWTHREYLDDTHASTFHRGLYDALEWAFAGWPMPAPKDTTAFEPTIAEIDAHYAALSKKFGFQVIAPPNALHRAAQALMKRKQTEAALDVWRRTARDYPYLTDGYSSLGRALEQLGRTNEARQAYEQALRVSAESQSAFIDTRSLQQRVKALRSQPESQR